ncbi:Ankyrin repeat-containing domain [Phytophthora cactorum]|nr:Ankyrin repeat-containing domain [Phytophthora cactorum]
MKLPAPLTSAIVVSRSHLDIAALPHIAETISAFLDCSVHWSLPAACGFAFQDGALRLVQRVTAHQAIDDRRSEEFLHQHPKFRISKSKIQRSEAILVLRQKEDPFYRQKLFTLGMARAAARGDLSVMQWLVQEFPGCYVTLAVEEAAKHGHLKVLQWLHRNSRLGHIRDEGGGRNDTGLDVFWGAKELFYAGLNGHLRVVQWLQEHTNPTPTHMFFVTLEEAAKNGDLPMVKWLCNVRGEWSPYAGILAASGGHLDLFALGKFYTLQWLKHESILEDLPESERHFE